MPDQFESPRFAGDAVLEDILRDPDTGTKKLQAGSPPDSVRRLQQALFDLGWNIRVDPPVHLERDFVVGIYGPKTTQIVRAYKTTYNIVYPPSAPTGSIDGLAGPRTLARLDQHCVLLDEAIATIRAKVRDLNADGTPVELLHVSHETETILGTSGTFSPATIAGTAGAIFYKRGVGAFEVHGPIFDVYLSGGFASGPFGFPTSDEHAVEDPFVRVSEFEHGFMRVEVSSGAVAQIGPEPAVPETPVF